MQKHIYALLLGISFIFSIPKVYGASPKPDTASTEKAESVPSPFKIPSTLSKDLSDYKRRFMELSGFELSGLHWKQFVRIYVNKRADVYVNNYLEYVRVYLNTDENADTAAAGKFQAYPVGTIFLKENYKSEDGKPGSPTMLTIMIKHQAGYYPQGGDWEYIYVGVDGSILFQGNASNPGVQAMCAKCHGNMRERDFIFSTFCSLTLTGH